MASLAAMQMARHGLRAARKIRLRGGTPVKGIVSKRKLHINRHRHGSMARSSSSALYVLNRRRFHGTPKARWTSPDDLTTPELRKECDRRAIASNGNRAALVARLAEELKKSGGYDNGLTLDESLVTRKRHFEAESNKIPDKRHSTLHLYVEERYQKKIAKQFKSDDRIKFHHELPSHVSLEGKYADIVKLRAEISQAQAEMASRETIYSLPHSVVLRLKRSVFAEIRTKHDVGFNIMRHKHNGEDMMLLSVEGEPSERMKACDALEEVIGKLKSHSVEVPGLESFSKGSASFPKMDDTTIHPSLLRESVAECFNVFDGIVMYLDPRMREMMYDYQGKLDSIAIDTNTNIYLGNRDLFWLNGFQLGIEGAREDVIQARNQIDKLINQLKSLTMTIVLPPAINNDMANESKQLASTIQKNQGVDTVIIQQNDFIYVHLIGETSQVHSAASIIDSRSYRLSKMRGDESKRLQKRDRIRNLNFNEYGVGGLDDTLRDMIRRTFESRLISPRLRKELGLQHVRGVLLYGPPGTGKTLIARKISEILGCGSPKIVNGPEVESKWVGEAEKNIRTLFEEAQAEFDEKGDDSQLHVVIFDEIDAIAKKRGGAHAKSRDGALNQLLCCMDGVGSIDNVIVFGLTNRKDCLDPALLRPGRLEAALEIGLPDASGREEILKIHTAAMREHGRLDDNVNLRTLAEFAEGFSGADLAGLVRSAVSYALEGMEEEDEVLISQELLQRGLHEVRFAKERMPDSEEPNDGGQPGLLQA